MSPALPISVVLPTLDRSAVLVETIRQLICQAPPPCEILVVDQTAQHPRDAEQALQRHETTGVIRRIRLSPPSQPAALNRGLLAATQPVVLFLDDDIRIDPGFVEAHWRMHQTDGVTAVAGQVLQPGQGEVPVPEPRNTSGRLADLDFPFNGARRCPVSNGMSGNLSVKREAALKLGGFDENFLPPVSYRFDSEFCKRLLAHGGSIVFEPAARIHHLRERRGGTRSLGGHMASASPIHGVGDYYFALRLGLCSETMAYMARRPFREVLTRFHLKHPWWIPAKLIGEMRALRLALTLHRGGPKLLSQEGRLDLRAAEHV